MNISISNTSDLVTCGIIQGAGIIYVSASDLGWQPIKATWMLRRPEINASRQAEKTHWTGCESHTKQWQCGSQPATNTMFRCVSKIPVHVLQVITLWSSWVCMSAFCHFSSQKRISDPATDRLRPSGRGGYLGSSLRQVRIPCKRWYRLLYGNVQYPHHFNPFPNHFC